MRLTSFCRHFTLPARMKMKLTLMFWLLLATAIFTTPARAQTNAFGTNNDTVANGYLQIQEQLHATQLAVEENRLTAADEARKNAETLAARLQSLEQTVTAQRNSDVDAARKTQQLTLMLAGAFGLVGLGIMLLMVYFQWRAFTQIAEISAQHQAHLVNASSVHQLAAPGRAAVESSNARLLDVVGQLEQRIRELEGGQRMLPEIAAVKSANLLDDGQQLLDANQPQKALESFDKFLAAQPNHAEALVKRAAALEKLGRMEEALAVCDRAIATNAGLVSAYLHKGGLLNRLRRYDEALNCFEQALLAQDKKSAAK
jgi:tetratricopeptide (TPR) repeat protein